MLGAVCRFWYASCDVEAAFAEYTDEEMAAQMALAFDDLYELNGVRDFDELTAAYAEYRAEVMASPAAPGMWGLIWIVRRRRWSPGRRGRWTCR